MRPAELLLRVEELDLRRQALEGEAAAAASRAVGDARVRELRGRRHELQAELQGQASQLRQLELETEQLAGRIKTQERSLYDGSVRHPADLQRRQHELQSLRAKVASQEEAELARMESQEATGKDLGRLESELAEREAEWERRRAEDRERAPEREAELERLAEQRSQLAAQLPAAALRTYERIAGRTRPALARVSHNACGGCRMPLATRLLQQARGEELVTCETCQRILVL